LAPYAIAASGLVTFAILVVRLWSFTVDDAYITLRYGQNLALGFGPTFNRDGQPIEGYTTFLWMMVSTLPHLIGWNAVIFVKALGVVLTLATLVLVAAAVAILTAHEHWSVRRLAVATAIAFLASSPAIAVHAVSGMETALAMALMTALFLSSIGMQDANIAQGRIVVTSVLALLLGLTRPEGNLFSLVLIAVIIARQAPRNRRRLVASVLLFYGLPGATYYLWRFAYYGHAFPLPFYIKVQSPLDFPGWTDVYAYLRAVLLPLAPLALVGAWRRRTAVLPGFVGAIVYVGFFIASEPIMGYEWRFPIPTLPLFVILASVGLGKIAWWTSSHLPDHLPGSTLVAIAAAGIVAGYFLIKAPWIVRERSLYAQGLARAHETLGRRLKQVDRAEAHTLSISDAGAVPYLSTWRTIDTFGLNYPTIALSRRHDPQTVMAEDPDVVVVLSARANDFVPLLDFEEPIYEAALASGMQRVWMAEFAPDYFLWALARPANRSALGFDPSG
jgi:hypothetical protein